MTRTLSILLTLVLTACTHPASPPPAPIQPPPASAPAAQPAQFRGFTLDLYYCRDVEAAKKEIDTLADLGCNSLNFVFTAMQDNIHSNTVSIPWKNHPASPEIKTIFLYAKSKGMRTMLMPIVLLEHSGPKDWRGVIEPEDWDNWFHSYTTYMKAMANIAKQSDVNVLSVGSELLTTETFRDRWLKVIAEVRKIYKGKLTYSANWDHFTSPTFWDQLDYIGMNNYNQLAKEPHVSVIQLVKNWLFLKNTILDFAKAQKKPVIFTEIGWHNVQNTIKEPWNYVAEGPIDLNEQKHAFESFIEAWKDVPKDQYMGAFIWQWVPGIDGATYHGAYSLQNTPALEVVKEWMKSAK